MQNQPRRRRLNGRRQDDGATRSAGARVACALALAGILAACDHEIHVAAAPQEASGKRAAEVVLAAPPPMSEGQFPCSDCHDPELPARTKRRVLEKAHQDIVLAHGGERMWCWDCHDVKDRDQLRAAGGALVPYEEAHVLCGQCHGEEVRDWQAGAHGRSTGSFAGTRTALRCASCHDAHAPPFEPLRPEAAPVRPRRTR
jgi:hypothetical protein